MMKKLYIIILLLLVSNLSANVVATVSALKGSADIKRIAEIFPAQLGNKLENKDNIFTKGNSKMQIIFLDETILTIGKNSNFSIEEYLFEENQEPAAKFNMVEGAMRVITGGIGKIAPHKFSVKTRTATIGIRGTNFTIIVRRDGTLLVYCTYGAISVTYNSKQNIVKQSYFIHISPNGDMEDKSFNSNELQIMRDKHFGLSKFPDGDSTKKDINSKESTSSKDFEESNERLDVKFKDDEVVLQDLIDTTPDYIVKDTYSETDASVIAGYSMQEAKYRGVFNTSFSNGSLYSSGDAAMTVNFGNDTAWLGLGNFDDPTEQVRYNFTDVNTNNISGTQVGNTGTANGAFYTTTGNGIAGSFEFVETTNAGTNEVTAQGVYDVATAQKLY